MGTIRIDAGSSAMFLSVSISAGLLSLQAFSHVFSDILFGVALVLLSVTTMILGKFHKIDMLRFKLNFN